MTDRKEYKGLHNLLAGSFYQCWDEYDDRSPSEIVDGAISDLNQSEIEEAIDDLLSIFNLISSNTNFEYILGHSAGCSYDPNYDGITDVEWLVALKNKLEQAKNN